MTTNNHPAHGPVSLDRLHQIREILSKAAAQSDGGNLGYAMADAVKVIDGVLAARKAGQEPVAWVRYCSDGTIDGPLLNYQIDDCRKSTWTPLYAAPPAPLVDWVPLGDSPYDVPYSMPSNLRELIAEEIGILFSVDDAQSVWNVCRSAAMLQSFGNPEQLIKHQSSNQDSDSNASGEGIKQPSTNEHGIETHALLKHIEGMEVSVDVSTCDADAGHRYFGTVTEISELDTARNGYILLVQDAKPNFKPAGNSPATPDGWQLVPKEPTEAMNKAGWAAMNEHDAINPTYRAMLAAAPQQDVRLALEIGMSRYAGAMQKLVDSGD